MIDFHDKLSKNLKEFDRSFTIMYCKTFEQERTIDLMLDMNSWKSYNDENQNDFSQVFVCLEL